jgi:hypothetical protein
VHLKTREIVRKLQNFLELLRDPDSSEGADVCLLGCSAGGGGGFLVFFYKNKKINK